MKHAGLQEIKGRGALSNRHSRYLGWSVEADEEEPGEDGARPATEVFVDNAKTIIATNRSPDVPFEQSINPYKGCEHGCIYCYARPTHAYLDLSPGLDFETKVFYKPDGPRLLEEALRRKQYRCRPIAFGTNTDPYQPIDQRLQVTRQLLEVLQRHRHPFTVVTKGSHLLRDLDILQDMAADNLCAVMLSITTLDNKLKRSLEPRAASPSARLRTMEALAEAGVPVGVLAAPVIPMVNDRELEMILAKAREAGATTAAYVFLRLPLEVKELFREWLEQHFPDRAQHVLSLLQQSRDGALNHSEFGKRMRGSGVFADLVQRRFKVACERYGLNQQKHPPLDCSRFRVPTQAGDQLSLW